MSLLHGNIDQSNWCSTEYLSQNVWRSMNVWRQNIFFYFYREASHVPRTFPCPGSLIVKNTIEDFKSCDKKALLTGTMNKVSYIWC